MTRRSGVRRYRGSPVKFYYLEDRRGRRLLDPEARPRVWSDRAGLAFRTRAAAERAIAQYFLAGPAAMREVIGLRVVSG